MQKFVLDSVDFRRCCTVATRPVWQGVSTDSLKFYLGPPCPSLLRPVGGPHPKRPYGRFWGGPLTGQAAYGRLLPPWIPRAVRAWFRPKERKQKETWQSGAEVVDIGKN
jgi:hypothetical protein